MLLSEWSVKTMLIDSDEAIKRMQIVTQEAGYEI